MKKTKMSILFLVLAYLSSFHFIGLAAGEKNKHNRISVLLRDGSVITTPDLQESFPNKDNMFTVLDRYIKLKSLSIDGLVFYQNKSKYMFDWDEITKSIHSIELLSPGLDVYQHGGMIITPKKGKKIKTDDATLLQYIGHDQPTSQLTVLEYDSYNKWWREAYLDIQKVKKIVFGSDELLKPTKKKSADNKKTSNGFETTAKGIEKRLTSAGPVQSVNLSIEFDVNSSRIRQHSFQVINELGKALISLKPEGKIILIKGHTDSDGSDKYNLKLSKKRANAVKTYLLKHFDLRTFRIQTRGYGETRPIAPNKGKSNKQKNRRVEIRLKS